MTGFLIISGTQNSGKTTTAGMVYKKLREYAKDPWLADISEIEISPDDSLIENGEPKDFLAYLEINGKSVAMISAGDKADYLKEYVEAYLEKSVDYIICCLRSINRDGSARRMLFTDFANYPKKEFWTVYSDDPKQKYAVKESVVNQIVSVIKSNQ